LQVAPGPLRVAQPVGGDAGLAPAQRDHPAAQEERRLAHRTGPAALQLAGGAKVLGVDIDPVALPLALAARSPGAVSAAGLKQPLGRAGRAEARHELAGPGVER